MQSLPIYLDYAATTPLDPRVSAAMNKALTDTFGNPSSAHAYGQNAKAVIDAARANVAALIQAEPLEIIWTSGATEANNLAIKGAAQLYKNKGKHLITLKTEHPAVLDCYQYLEKQGFVVTYLNPESTGLLDLKKLEAAIREDTILVSIMHVNNEIGVIQDIQVIADITSKRGILFHVDAAQSAGKVAIDLQKTPVDLMSFAAHKIYGPKGVGALYVRRKPRVKVASQLHGGGQEQGMRSGTLATHQIVGMGEAFAIAKNEMEVDHKHMYALRNQFLEGLSDFNVNVNGDLNHAVPNILNIRFDNIRSDKFIQDLPELAFSAGSACHSKGVEPSYVLRSLGLNEADAACGVRFSFGRFTTIEHIEFALQKIREFISSQ